MKIRSFVAWIPRGGGAGRMDSAAPPGENARGWIKWRDESLTVWFAPRSPQADAGLSAGGLPDMVLGDDSELTSASHEVTLAGGVPVRYDRTGRTLVVHTSVVALPPIFLYRGTDALAVSSDIALLVGLPGVRLGFDPRGVTELGWFGHPVEHRTLFKDVELVPAGGRLRVSLDGNATFERIWQLPDSAPVSWTDFIEAQISAFTTAIRRMDVRRSFLSLTAGLDTRTVFSTLAAQQGLVPGVTMTGPRPSLDARTAARLCRAYGIPHRPVVLGAEFVRDLPNLVERSSTLSGGLSSLGQAPEVFLYRQLGDGFSARLSGNLGNQVGRGGTEGVSIRGADLGILGPDLRTEMGDEHWLLGRLKQHPQAAMEFILQSEIAFSSVGNYSIGNHFAAQQSPYASRTLIETLATRPAVGTDLASRSKLQMRLRDLKHRFVGEPEHASFQRTLVKRAGGAAARIPINWGWRPAGGPSPVGLALGAATLVGMIARAKGFDDGALGGLLNWSGLPALHDFRESRRWLREDLKVFTMDTLNARAVREAGLFDQARLAATLDGYFRGQRNQYETVTFALDLALAHRMVSS